MENSFLFCAHHQDVYPKGNNNQGIDKDQLKGRNIGSDFVKSNILDKRIDMGYNK